jgi:hypothetical protein
MGKNVEGSGRGLTLLHYTDICMEGLRRAKKHLSQGSRSPGRDLSQNLPNTKQEY